MHIRTITYPTTWLNRYVYHARYLHVGSAFYHGSKLRNPLETYKEEESNLFSFCFTWGSGFRNALGYTRMILSKREALSKCPLWVKDQKNEQFTCRNDCSSCTKIYPAVTCFKARKGTFASVQHRNGRRMPLKAFRSTLAVIGIDTAIAPFSYKTMLYL